jgi:hypothetical protein
MWKAKPLGTVAITITVAILCRNDFHALAEHQEIIRVSTRVSIRLFATGASSIKQRLTEYRLNIIRVARLSIENRFSNRFALQIREATSLS